jgi:arsenate reductase-like glutaredoxin family protein
LREATGEERVMSPTVHEVRNAIRVATGRFEREIEASFTKEELQAICEALEVDVDATGRSSTTQMRRLVRVQVGIAESLEVADDSTFRKAELQAIADGVGASFEP